MAKKQNSRTWLALFLIILLATILRFWKLSEYPVGFHMDEASKGYSAYSLLKTGRDDNNNRFPLYIDIFGDNSPAGYHYLTIIPVAFFGLTEFAVRFPGAFFGVFSIFACYFFAYSLFENKKISLLSALFLAISPWHINLSRASSESQIALFFILLGFSFVFRSLKKQSIKHLILGISLLSISFFFYQTPRVFVPLLFLAVGIFYFLVWKIQTSSQYKKAFICLFIMLSLFDSALIFLVSGGTGRFTQVNIFSYPETRLLMEEQILEDGISGTSVFMTRFFHNKVINFFLTYLSNYLEDFSWNFLFIKGLPPWYFVPGMGVMYLVELPLVVLGVILLASHKQKLYRIPLIWLILAPTAAAIGTDVNNLQRVMVMFPMLEITAAFGLAHVFTLVSKRQKLIVICFTILLFSLNIVYFFHQYFIHAKVHRPWYRYNGFTEMILTVKKSYDSYDKIIVTKSMGGIYPLIQFYMRYDPKLYQQEGSPKDREYTGFGKFFFVPVECPSLQKSDKLPKAERIIYVNRGNCQPDIRYKETVIYREDGTEAFRIVYEDKKIY